jgi:hypothetical protein
MPNQYWFDGYVLERLDQDFFRFEGEVVDEGFGDLSFETSEGMAGILQSIKREYGVTVTLLKEHGLNGWPEIEFSGTWNAITFLLTDFFQCIAPTSDPDALEEYVATAEESKTDD